MVEKEVVVRLQLWHGGDKNDEVVKKEESGDIMIIVKEVFMVVVRWRQWKMRWWWDASDGWNSWMILQVDYYP
jgi:hypothetical protein